MKQPATFVSKWFPQSADNTADKVAAASLPLRSLATPEMFFVAALTLAVMSVVCYFAWLSDDSFYGLRYISNTINGYGLVFNVGERVQGYTNPLWILLLVAGSFVFPNPIAVMYSYNFLLTLLTVALVFWAILRVAPNFQIGALLSGIAAGIWISSDPWISFQTSGLENSLTHLLIVGIVWETWVRSVARPGWLMLLLCLMCLTRPDYLVWVAPLGLLLLTRIRSVGQFAVLALATVPVWLWLLFAWMYYHDVIPNTFYAKVGIYPSLAAAINQGFAYLGDWLHYDILAAGGTLVFFGVATWNARSLQRIALLAGIVLYAGWVILVGGDFMRGRFFTSVLTAVIFTGMLTLAEQLHAPSQKWLGQLVVAGYLLAILLAARLWITEPAADIENPIIVNERKGYPGYSLWHCLRYGRIESPYFDNEFVNLLRSYAHTCGPFTIHSLNPAALGYLTGPEVSVIDTLGMTDAFVAKLPKENLIQKNLRPGHPYKLIPASYLIERKDVELVDNWMELLKQGDCSLPEKVGELKKYGDVLGFPK